MRSGSRSEIERAHVAVCRQVSLREAENMTRNFDPSGGPMRRVAVALAAVLALNPGVALAAPVPSNEAGAAAVPGALGGSERAGGRQCLR